MSGFFYYLLSVWVFNNPFKHFELHVLSSLVLYKVLLLLLLVLLLLNVIKSLYSLINLHVDLIIFIYVK